MLKSLEERQRLIDAGYDYDNMTDAERNMALAQSNLDARMQYVDEPVWEDIDIKSLLPELQQRLSGVIDPAMQRQERAISSIEDRAYSQGPSLWAQGQMDAADKQVAGEFGQAYSQLASTGGIDSGASERLAKSAMEAGMMAKQDVARQDDLMKQQLQQAMPGMAAAQADLGLKGVSLWGNQAGREQGLDVQEQLAKRSFDMDKYGKYLELLGSEAQAQATENAGKK